MNGSRTSLILLLCMGSAFAFSQQYVIQDLGVELSQSFGTLVINNSGVVGGTTVDGDAFRWTTGTTEVIHVAGIPLSVEDINDSGVIAGYGLDSSLGRAMLIAGATASFITPPMPGDSSFEAVNNSGVTAGSHLRPGGSTTYHTPATYGSTWTSLSMPAGYTHGRAEGINGAGVVVGEGANSSGTSAMIWVGGINQLLPNPEGLSVNYGTQINDAGDVIVSSSNSSGTIKKTFLRHNNLYSQLLSPHGLMFIPSELTNSGLMVGMDYSSGSAETGWLRNADGTYFNLTAYFQSNTGLAGLLLRDVNESGQIVATSSVGQSLHAFVLTPVPEPVSLVVLGFGVLFFRRRRAN